MSFIFYNNYRNCDEGFEATPGIMHSSSFRLLDCQIYVDQEEEQLVCLIDSNQYSEESAKKTFQKDNADFIISICIVYLRQRLSITN